MRTTIHDFDGMTADEIKLMVQPVFARLDALEKMVCSNGRPSLEDRMYAYVRERVTDLKKHVDERDEHKANNALQANVLIRALVDATGAKVDESIKKQDERHIANLERFGKIDKTVAYATGYFAAVVFFVGLGIVLLNHYWKA